MKTLFLYLISFFLTQNIFAQWTNGQSAEYVLGQPDFTTYTSGSATNKFHQPGGVAIDYTNNKLYIADIYNHRVLRFSYPISGNQPTPERVFGTGSSTPARNTLPYPSSVAVYDGALWVVNDRRITKFINAHSVSSDGPNADVVLGQTNFTNMTYSTTQSTFMWPTDIVIDDNGNMWVADNSSHRVLKFNNVNSKSNGANADLVLGQSNFTSGSGATTQSGMYSPNGVTVLGTTVWVADYDNNRVLRYDNPTSNGANASGVLGQTSYTSNTSGLTISAFAGPYDVTIDAAGRLYVSDYPNGRIMIFNDAANKTNGGDADNVLGQTNFTTTATTNGGSSNYYYDSDVWKVGPVTVDPTNNKLLVTDENNNRVMVFSASSPLPVELTSFTANALNNKISLNWQTATEVDNYGFDVQRSVLSGQFSDWETIGFLHGHGNSNSPKDYSFVDDKVSSVGKYFYRLKQIDTDGSYEYSKIVEVDFGQPNKFELKQNYPNPFNPRTVISYQLSTPDNVTLKIYDVLGNEVAVLVDNEWQEAGKYNYQFSPDASGLNSQFASGLFFYQLRAGDFVQVKKMILAK